MENPHFWPNLVISDQCALLKFGQKTDFRSTLTQEVGNSHKMACLLWKNGNASRITLMADFLPCPFEGHNLSQHSVIEDRYKSDFV